MKQLTIFVVLFQFSCFLIDRRLVHHTSTVHLTDQQLKFSLWGDNLKEMDCEPPTYLSYFSMIASLCLSCITIAGNLLVLLAVYQDPYKELRKPFTFLIANLALADLTAGAITEPMAVYFTYQEVQGSVVNDLAVYVTHLSYFMSCTTSVLTLSVLAIDRYLAISYSLWYKGKRRKAEVTAFRKQINQAILDDVGDIFVVFCPFLFVHLCFVLLFSVWLFCHSLVERYKFPARFKQQLPKSNLVQLTTEIFS